MAVDRGGLRYTISVEDRFSKQIARLKSQLKSLEVDLNRVSKARARFNTSQLQNNSATNAATAAATRQGNAIAASSRKIVSAQVANQRALVGTQRALRRTGAAARTATFRVNRLGFSFRRLIGIIAVLQAARVGSGLFGGLIGGGIKFNQTIENAEIAMASLFVTVGRIRDAQGNLVTGAKAFALAQGVAAEQTRLLRLDAVQTTATFVELQRAFQAGIGPGLEAGLKIDEIREVTVRIAQAASALGLENNQLVEEIRSLLRGTIQSRTTVVASVLGITNEDIRAAKEAGDLIGFLRKKLDGFSEAALAIQGTLTGLSARLKDTFGVTTGAASEKLFRELKFTLVELSNLFVTIEQDAKGAITAITPREDTVALFIKLFDALKSSVIIIREGLGSISLENLTSAFKGLGTLFETLAAFFTGLIQGFVKGFATASNIVNNLIGELGGLGAVLPVIEQIGNFIGEWGTLIIGALVGLTIMSKTISLLAIPARALVSILSGLVSTVVKLAVGFAALPLPVLVVVAALSAAIPIFNDWIKSIAGFQVRLGTLVKIVKDGLLNVLVLVGAKLRELFLGTFEAVIIEGLSATIAATVVLLQDALRKVASVIAALPLPFAKAQSTGIRALVDGLDGLVERLDKVSSKSAEAQAALEAATAAAAKQVIEDFDTALADDPSAFDLGAFIEDGVVRAVAALNFLIGPDLVDKDKIKEDIQEGTEAGVESAADSGRTQSALAKLAAGMVKSIESGVTIARIVIDRFAGFITDVIVDAFDPNAEGDLEDKFTKLFQGIVKAIIAELVKLAIAKTILQITGAAEGGQVANQGKARGGQMHHSRPRGFDGGGVVPGGQHSTPQFRPASVAKSDTVNAWLTPKEFVHPVQAVNSYGADLMELMRRGAVDPGLLRAAAGLSNKRASALVSSSSHRRGYASGGGVSDSASPERFGVGGGSDAIVAVVAGNDRAMDRLLAGGKNSMLDFVADNSATIDGILSKNRAR